MSRVAALAGLALLAGCGPSPQPPAVDSGRTAAAPVSTPAAPVGGMRAQVSALAADTSGLNVRVTDTATIVDLPADTLFAFDSGELTPGAADNLGKAADAIRRGAPGPVTITGHTDARGDDAYNLALSERRAAAVAQWMGEQVGVRQRAFTVSGKGETAPIAPNARPDGADDPDGRARNRRVEIAIPR